MPAKIKVTREDILAAALQLVREQGETMLTARALAARLGCSTQPIFSNFEHMLALRAAVIGSAWELYSARIARDMAAGRYTPFKASGMSYIGFAVEEPRLFQLLFMRDRITDGDADIQPEVDNVIRAVMDSTGFSRDAAERFHRVMWIFVHGLAVMFATRFSVYDEETVSGMLTDAYLGLMTRFGTVSAASDRTEDTKRSTT